jgi:hypothetical protein
MTPAPATIASRPRLNSRTCWNPAVPPPPVAGASAGNELAAGLGDAAGPGLGVVTLGAVVLGVAAPAVVVPGVAVLGVPLEVVAPGVPLSETVGVAEPRPPGENEGGVVGAEPVEQADTDVAASMARAAQPRTFPGKRHRP